MAICPRFSGYLIKREPQQNRILVTRTRCKMWDCEFCAKKNKADWRQRIANGVSKFPLWAWYFWTVTAHESDRTPEGSLKNISKAWSQLVNIIRKRVKRDLNEFHYIRVLEAHANGAIHIHALVAFKYGVFRDDLGDIKYTDEYSEPFSGHWIPDESEISYLNREAGAGYICDVKKLPSKDLLYVAAYVTKYLTKMEKKLPKNVRRVQCSQGWIKPEKKNEVPSGWEIRRSITEIEAYGHWRNNVELYDIQLKKEITADDFNDGRYSSEQLKT